MRKFVAGLIVVPLGVLLVALAVVNRKPVMLGLNPFDGNSDFGVEAPFFLFLLGAFALGLVIGGLVTWLGQGKWRRTARIEAPSSALISGWSLFRSSHTSPAAELSPRKSSPLRTKPPPRPVPSVRPNRLR